jgi:hypothetical protein
MMEISEIHFKTVAEREFTKLGVIKLAISSGVGLEFYEYKDIVFIH